MFLVLHLLPKYPKNVQHNLIVPNHLNKEAISGGTKNPFFFIIIYVHQQQHLEAARIRRSPTHRWSRYPSVSSNHRSSALPPETITVKFTAADGFSFHWTAKAEERDGSGGRYEQQPRDYHDASYDNK